LDAQVAWQVDKSPSSSRASSRRRPHHLAGRPGLPRPPRSKTQRRILKQALGATVEAGHASSEFVMIRKIRGMIFFVSYRRRANANRSRVQIR
jgi:hypothetical protein